MPIFVFLTYCWCIMLLEDQSKEFLSKDTLTQALTFISSWIILLAIGVIVSGKLLAQRLKLDAGSGQLFRIPIRGVLTIEATGAEVVLGFTFYLISVLLLGIVFGAYLQPWVKAHFGIDPGQFNALGFVSSLLSVTVSFVIYIVSAIPINALGGRSEQHHALLDKITSNGGVDPKSLQEVKQ